MKEGEEAVIGSTWQLYPTIDAVEIFVAGESRITTAKIPGSDPIFFFAIAAKLPGPVWLRDLSPLSWKLKPRLTHH